MSVYADKGVTGLLMIIGRKNVLVEPITEGNYCSSPWVMPRCRLWKITEFRADLPSHSSSHCQQII